MKILNLLMIIAALQFASVGVVYAKTGCCSNHCKMACCQTTGHHQARGGMKSSACGCKAYAKTQRCCSKHGGVVSCNKAKGVFRCKDGTSSACKCSK